MRETERQREKEGERETDRDDFSFLKAQDLHAPIPKPSIPTLNPEPSTLEHDSQTRSAGPCFSFLLLSSLELSDIKVYEHSIRALLGAASHFCVVVVLEWFCNRQDAWTPEEDQRLLMAYQVYLTQTVHNVVLQKSFPRRSVKSSFI